jgi:hypothetical protein
MKKKKPFAPLVTWDVGHGEAEVEMGLYHTGVHDDDDKTKILKYGLTLCPVKGADNFMKGLVDPEQHKLIGFSEDGSGVAVMDGSEKPDNLTEAQRDTARNLLNRLSARLDDHAITTPPSKHMRTSPVALGEPSAWDAENSIELHFLYEAEYAGAHGNAAKNFNSLINNTVADFNRETLPADMKESLALTHKPFHVTRIPKKSGSKVEAVSEGKDESVAWLKELHRVLAEHVKDEAARNKVATAMIKFTQKLAPPPPPPGG